MVHKAKKHIHSLLQKGSKKMGTDLVYIAEGGFWITLGQGASSLSGIAMAIGFANLLPIETYGNMKFVLSFLSLLSIPTLQGMNQAITRTVAQGHDNTIYPALITRIKGGVLGMFVSLSIALYYSMTHMPTIALSFIILSISIPFFQTLPLWKDYLNGKKKFRALGIYQSIGNIIRASTILLTLFFTHNLFIILGVYLFVHILVHGITFLITIQTYPPKGDTDTKTISYAKHLSVMSILDIIANQVDKIILYTHLGPASIALYTLALRPIEGIRAPLQGMMKLSLPKMSNRDIATLRRTLPKKIIFSSLILIPFITLYIILAPLFFSLVFPQYIDAVIYSQIFALSLIFYPKKLIWSAFTAHTQKKELYIANTLIPFIKIVLFIFILPTYGVWGAIITLIIVEGLSYITLWILFFYSSKITPSSRSSSSESFS